MSSSKTARSYCQTPSACVAGKRGRCMPCQPIGAEELARRKASMKRRMADPETRDRHLAALRSPDCRAEMSERAKESWANPEIRKRRIAGLIRAWGKSAP